MATLTPQAVALWAEWASNRASADDWNRLDVGLMISDPILRDRRSGNMDLPGICGERFRFYAARPSN